MGNALKLKTFACLEQFKQLFKLFTQYLVEASSTAWNLSVYDTTSIMESSQALWG